MAAHGGGHVALRSPARDLAKGADVKLTFPLRIVSTGVDESEGDSF